MLDTTFSHKLNCPSSPPQKSHFLVIYIYIRYLSCRQIHQESICMISSLSRFAFSRYTVPDTGLIQNLQVSSFFPHLSHQNLICWWSISTLGIFPAGESVQMLHCESIYKHLPHQNPNYWWSKSTLGMFLTGKSIKSWFARFHHCHAPLVSNCMGNIGQPYQLEGEYGWSIILHL